MAEMHSVHARLEDFGRGRLSRSDGRNVIRHLLAGCPTCREMTARLVTLEVERTEPFRAGAPSFDYSTAFDNVRRMLRRHQVAFAAERSAAPALLAELSALPFERQWAAVTSEARFQTWALCDLLLDASREWGFKDPGRALELAELGAAVAAQLNRQTYGDIRVNDLSARAWATLANAERIRSDFRAAERGFARAERLLQAGTGDPLEKARVLLLKASLRGNQGRFEETFRLLDRVAKLARRNGDGHLGGKAKITRGFFAGLAGRADEAIPLLEEGLREVDAKAEPRLVVAARHNLILHLNDGGRHGEALALLAELRPLYAELGDRMNMVRLRWLEGKIEAALGRLATAETLFRQVSRELVEQEIGYDTALLSLDLAHVYARQGRTAELRRLAEEMIPIFQSRDMHREAVAALIVFQKAAEVERVTLGLVQDLADYLRRSRDNPGLRLRDSV